MKKYKFILIILNLAIVLLFFHYSVAKKEAILGEGRLILLRLAPVDPRSLMQGDYMDLRYEIGEGQLSDSLPKRGFCVVSLDSGMIARKVRMQPGRKPLHPGEYLIEYSTPDHWRLKIGAESYFFEEGQAARYQGARYGGVKVDDKGNSVLVGLYDAGKQLIR